MQNKILNIPQQFIPVAAGNLLNSAVTTLGSGIGWTPTQPYILIKHVRVTNKDNIAHVITIYKGLTAGSAAGTEIFFAAYSLPAASFQDWYGQVRIDSADFISGIADLASKVTIEFDAEVGLS